MFWASVHHFIAHGQCTLFSNMYIIFICRVLSLCSLIYFISVIIYCSSWRHTCLLLCTEIEFEIGKLISYLSIVPMLVQGNIHMYAPHIASLSVLLDRIT